MRPGAAGWTVWRSVELAFYDSFIGCSAGVAALRGARCALDDLDGETGQWALLAPDRCSAGHVRCLREEVGPVSRLRYRPRPRAGRGSRVTGRCGVTGCCAGRCGRPVVEWARRRPHRPGRVRGLVRRVRGGRCGGDRWGVGGGNGGGLGDPGIGAGLGRAGRRRSGLGDGDGEVREGLGDRWGGEEVGGERGDGGVTAAVDEPVDMEGHGHRRMAAHPRSSVPGCRGRRSARPIPQRRGKGQGIGMGIGVPPGARPGSIPPAGPGRSRQAGTLAGGSPCSTETRFPRAS